MGIGSRGDQLGVEIYTCPDHFLWGTSYEGPVPHASPSLITC